MLTNHRLRRRIVEATLLVLTAGTLAACGGSDTDDDASSLKVQLSWFTNAQNGGWTTAYTEGYLEDAGFDDVELLPGGPNVSGIPLLTAGRVDLAVVTAESYLEAREQGLPVTAVYNEFDQSPTGVLFKSDNGWSGWDDLADRSWSVAPASLGWQWVKESQGIDFQTQNFNGTYSAFFAKDDLVTQGYPTNTVYEARQEGYDLDYLSYTSAGFNPYGQIIIATDDYIAEHGDEITAALEALSKGWTSYLTDVDAATTANDQMVEENETLDTAVNWFTWDGQRQFVIGDRGGEQMGAMGDDRWAELVEQMKQMDALDGTEIDAGDLYTNEFLSDETMPTLTDLPAAPEGSYEGDAPELPGT